MSISEYEGTVYALANNLGEYFTRINITNPYDIREIHTENIHDFMVIIACSPLDSMFCPLRNYHI